MTMRTGSAAQGITAGARYQVSPRVLIFARRSDGCILLLKGAPDKKIWPGRYNGPGGHIESGEDPLTAAQRELREESGIVLPSTAFRLAAVVTVDVSGNGSGVLLFVFVAEVADGVDRQERGSAEGTLEWHQPENVAQLPTVEDVPWLVSTVFGRPPGTGPVFARYGYTDSNVLQINEVPDDIG